MLENSFKGETKIAKKNEHMLILLAEIQDPDWQRSRIGRDPN